MVGFRLLTETFVADVTRVCVGGVQMKKPEQKDRASLSPYVEKPLNSKVIKKKFRT